MKLTQRDKRLLMLMFVFAVVVVGFVYFIKPALSERETLETELDIALNEQTLTQSRIAALPADTAYCSELMAKHETLSESFFPMMENREADAIVTGMLLDEGLMIRSVQITQSEAPVAVQPFNDETGEQPKSVSICVVSLRVEGEEQALWRAVDAFANGKASLRIDEYELSLKLTEDAATPTGELNMTLCLYMVDKSAQ